MMHSREIIERGYAIPLYSTSKEKKYFRTSVGDICVCGDIELHDIGLEFKLALENDVLKLHRENNG